MVVLKGELNEAQKRQLGSQHLLTQSLQAGGARLWDNNAVCYILI